MAKKFDETVSFKAGEIIIEENGEAREAYLVRSGRVRIFTVETDGQRRNIALLGPGQIFGEMALIRGYNHGASAEAVDDVTAVRISEKIMELKLAKTDPMIKTILASLIERLYKETFLNYDKEETPESHQA